MYLKKFLYASCIFYIVAGLFNLQLVFAYTKYCSFSNLEIEGVEVALIGDRKIYTLFTGHLLAEHIEPLNIIGSHGPEEAIPLFNQLLEEYQEIIASEQSDAQKIIELAQSEKIDWIGIEDYNRYASYADRDVNDNYLNDQYLLQKTVRYLSFRDFISPLNHLPGWNSNKTTQLLFLIFPAQAIIRANHPEVFRRVKTYPLENQSLKTETMSRANNVFYWDRFILEDTRITSYEYSQVWSFIKKAHPLNPISNESLDALLNMLEIRRDARENMRNSIKAYNDFISLIPQRGARVVQSVLNLPGNGLITFGAFHGPGVKRGLITACRNGNGSP